MNNIEQLTHLDQKLATDEVSALDNPDQLFAISYLRGHLDLYLADNESTSVAGFKSVVRSAFTQDRLSGYDIELIEAELSKIRGD
jgi:hypothetical protein